MSFDLPAWPYNLLQKAVHGEYEWQRREIERFRKNRPGKLIEIGCGTGLLSRFFEPGSYVGVDIDEDRIEHARTAHPEHEFEVLDLTKPGQIDLERFDLVLCHGCIHHIGDGGVHTILDNFRNAAHHRQRPVDFLLIEPVLPRRKRFNLPGYILAKLDRGKFVRPLDQMVTLFNGTSIVNVDTVKGKWFWPVPGVVMTLSVS